MMLFKGAGVRGTVDIPLPPARFVPVRELSPPRTPGARTYSGPRPLRTTHEMVSSQIGPVAANSGLHGPFFFVPPCVTLKCCGALCCGVHGHITDGRPCPRG